MLNLIVLSLHIISLFHLSFTFNIDVLETEKFERDEEAVLAVTVENIQVLKDTPVDDDPDNEDNYEYQSYSSYFVVKVDKFSQLEIGGIFQKLKASADKTIGPYCSSLYRCKDIAFSVSIFTKKDNLKKVTTSKPKKLFDYDDKAINNIIPFASFPVDFPHCYCILDIGLLSLIAMMVL